MVGLPLALVAKLSTAVTVFIPEYVVGHWWASVPWQLNSSERLKTLQPHGAPGDARRGIFD